MWGKQEKEERKEKGGERRERNPRKPEKFRESFLQDIGLGAGSWGGGESDGGGAGREANFICVCFYN